MARITMIVSYGPGNRDKKRNPSDTFMRKENGMGASDWVQIVVKVIEEVARTWRSKKGIPREKRTETSPDGKTTTTEIYSIKRK